jgi:hypothetical protein
MLLQEFEGSSSRMYKNFIAGSDMANGFRGRNCHAKVFAKENKCTQLKTDLFDSEG